MKRLTPAAALLLTLATAAGAGASVSDPGPAIVRLWNRFVEVTRLETEADLRLQDSMKDFNPALLAGPYGPRRELLDEAIRLSDERTRLLRGMRDAEFGARDR